jgi:hypothetical protein
VPYGLTQKKSGFLTGYPLVIPRGTATPTTHHEIFRDLTTDSL